MRHRHLCCWPLVVIYFVLVSSVRRAPAAPVLFIANLDDVAGVRGMEGHESVIELMFLSHDIETVDQLDTISVDPTGQDEAIPIVQWQSALWDEMLASSRGRNLAFDGVGRSGDAGDLPKRCTLHLVVLGMLGIVAASGSRLQIHNHTVAPAALNIGAT